MIDLDPEELLGALEAHGRKVGLGVRPDRHAMVAATAEARALAAGQTENELPATARLRPIGQKSRRSPPERPR